MNTSKVISIPFRHAQLISNNSTSFTGSCTELDLLPENFGSRLADMAADYQKYRFVHLKVTMESALYPVSTTAGAGSSIYSFIGFDPLPSSSTGAVSGLEPCSQLLKFAGKTGGEPMGFTLSRKDLLGRSAVKWFETTSTGTPPDLMRYQGCFYSASVSSTLITLMNTVLTVEGVCEFSVPVDPADAAALERRLARDVARLRQLKIATEEKQASPEDYVSLRSQPCSPHAAPPMRRGR